MPVHHDELCDCQTYCSFCETDYNCAACCPEHFDMCPDCGRDYHHEEPCVQCGCTAMKPDLECVCECHDCPCRYDGPSDDFLRREERRQMGIT